MMWEMHDTCNQKSSDRTLVFSVNLRGVENPLRAQTKIQIVPNDWHGQTIAARDNHTVSKHFH